MYQDIQTNGYKNILVVSHGGLIFKMNVYLQGLGIIEDMPESDPYKYNGPKNTGISKFSLKISPDGELVAGKCSIFMCHDHLDK